MHPALRKCKFSFSDVKTLSCYRELRNPPGSSEAWSLYVLVFPFVCFECRSHFGQLYLQTEWSWQYETKHAVGEYLQIIYRKIISPLGSVYRRKQSWTATLPISWPRQLPDFAAVIVLFSCFFLVNLREYGSLSDRYQDFFTMGHALSSLTFMYSRSNPHVFNWLNCKGVIDYVFVSVYFVKCMFSSFTNIERDVKERNERPVHILFLCKSTNALLD